LSFEFFADRNCGGRQFPSALERAGIRVHRHDDHFAVDANDDEWLPEVGARGWVVLSFDKRILVNELERDAVFLSRGRLILLTGANASAAQLAANFIHTYPRIEQFLHANPAPFIARVKRPSPVSDVDLGRPGEIEMRMTEQEWKARYSCGR
jgi:hypothetical protein